MFRSPERMNRAFAKMATNRFDELIELILPITIPKLDEAVVRGPERKLYFPARKDMSPDDFESDLSNRDTPLRIVTNHRVKNPRHQISADFIPQIRVRFWNILHDGVLDAKFLTITIDYGP